MSIAMSVLSGPSRSGTLLMAMVSTVLIAVGTISVVQLFGDSAIITACIASGGMALAVFNGQVLRRRCGNVKLTILNNGQLSLVREGQGCIEVDAEGKAGSRQRTGRMQSDIVQLMPDSTLWSFFILLRLRHQNKKITVVPFFLYSLSPQSFRRLSVACRWIIARSDTARSNSQTIAYPYRE